MNFLKLRKFSFYIFIIGIFFTIPNLVHAQSIDSLQGQQHGNNDTLALPQGQDSIITDCEQNDLGSTFRKKSKPEKPPKKRLLLILPKIASNPTNGFMIGLGGTYGSRFGPAETTKISMITLSAAVTSKQQFLSFIKSNMFTPNNKFFLQGDWRFNIFQGPTWGLGTNAPDTIDLDNTWIWEGADVSDTEGAFNLRYNYFKFHEIVNYKVADNLFVGIGYHLDVYNNIEDDKLNLDTFPRQLTPHYGHSIVFGYDHTSYTLSGMSLNFVYDSRDNLINPYEGHYINVNYRINPTFLGSDQNSTSLWLEYRTYVSVSKKAPRHLVGFWFISDIQVSGNRPYLTLMATGEDQLARSGRGYIGGRYRGKDFMYAEVEYRFPIGGCNSMVGGVVFANATTAANFQEAGLFDYIRPGFGIGLRFMINKEYRTNLNLEIAKGYKSQGFYLSGTETF